MEQNGISRVYGLYRRAHCDRWNFVTHKVGKRIRPLNVEKQRSEATFRTNLVQHNKQAELIALSNAESLQRQELSDNFHTIKENWHRLMNRQRWLDYW